jgi:hypothetical protein
LKFSARSRREHRADALTTRSAPVDRLKHVWMMPLWTGTSAAYAPPEIANTNASVAVAFA